MNIIFLGAPGSGKGTQANILEKKYGIKHLSTGDMLRNRGKIDDELGKSIKNLIDNGFFVDDETMLKILEEKFLENSESGYILDGYPRNLNQAKSLDELVKKLGRTIDLVVNLKIDDNVVLKRITDRWVCRCGKSYNYTYNPPATKDICDKCGGTLYKRKDDNENSIKVRLVQYYNMTEPLINYYKERNLLVDIDALQSIGAVNESIVNILEEKRSDN